MSDITDIAVKWKFSGKVENYKSSDIRILSDRVLYIDIINDRKLYIPIEHLACWSCVDDIEEDANCNCNHTEGEYCNKCI